MRKCPVCDKELIEVYYHASEWGTEESQYKCPNNCYIETFAYGGTEINICDFMTSYYYNTPRKDIDKIYKQIEAISIIERQIVKDEIILPEEGNPNWNKLEKPVKITFEGEYNV
jgi:hypothetical protein